jgi:cell division protein FtsN
MSRDLKHRVPAFRQPRRKQWVTPQLGLALVVGFLFVAVLAAGYQRYTVPEEVRPMPSPRIPAPPPDPAFRFFKILPDTERRIPENVIIAEQRDARLGKAPTEGHYFLQIGSFTRKGQADQLKAQLETLVGFKPRVEQINLEYATWYRVKLGPYRTLPDAERVRQFLRERKVDSIVQAPVE